MFEPSHLPNKKELIMVAVVVFISFVATGIIFPLLISTDKIPLAGIIGLFLLILVAIIIGIQSIFNLFYKTWQKRNEKR